MDTLASMLEAFKIIPEENKEEKILQLERIKDVYALVVRNLQNRNNELIVAETVQTQFIGLVMEQRFMLFTVLGDIKKIMDKEGRPDDPIVHMIFSVVETIKEMDHEWQEQIGDKGIKS